MSRRIRAAETSIVRRRRARFIRHPALSWAGALAVLCCCFSLRGISLAANAQDGERGTKPREAVTPITPPAATQPMRIDFVRNPVIDESEREVPKLRIASESPSITELCCALGLRDWLVARTQYCTYPPEIEKLPSIGALTETNVESLLALKPDVILLTDCSAAIRDRLAPFKFKLVELPAVKLEDLFVSIERLGDLAGRPRSAKRLAAAIRKQLDDAAATHKRDTSRSVLIVTDALTDPPTPPFVAGQGSFYDDLLRLAGHRNAAPGGSPFAPISLEYIVRTNPDVIIEIDADGASRPKGDDDALRIWRKIGPLSAAESKRIHVLVGPQHFLLGPRIAETMAELLDRVDDGTQHPSTATKTNAHP